MNATSLFADADTPPVTAERTATISPCGRYRYTLGRRWGDGPLACWVMLNPSTADATQDDPTVRRCIGFSKAWGYGGLVVVNLFAFRATDPAELLARRTLAVGPDNDAAILAAAESSSVVVAAWGVHGTHLGRADAVTSLIRRAGYSLRCLGRTKGGLPRHPLYVAAATPTEPFAG